jgi:hypothetical protein
MKAGMESVEYTLMEEVEKTMWWYHGSRSMLRDSPTCSMRVAVQGACSR